MDAALLGTTPATADGARSPLATYAASRLAIRDLAFEYTRLVVSRTVGYAPAVGGNGTVVTDRTVSLVVKRLEDRVVVDGMGAEIDPAVLPEALDPDVWTVIDRERPPARVRDHDLGPLIEEHNRRLAEKLGLSASDVAATEAQPVPHWSDLMQVCPATIPRREPVFGLSSALEVAFGEEYPRIGRACRGKAKFGRAPG